MSDDFFALYYKPDKSNDKLYFAGRDENGRFTFIRSKYGADLFSIYGIQAAKDEISEALGINIDIEEYEDDE
jgi:hypothetical protein